MKRLWIFREQDFRQDDILRIVLDGYVREMTYQEFRRRVLDAPRDEPQLLPLSFGDTSAVEQS